MKHINYLFIYSALLFSSAALAQQRPLYFTPAKNNVKILQQKFEYNILDKNIIRIGDILINTSNISFKIITKDDKTQLEFQWPVSLISSGNILIRDHTGKALFESIIERSKVQLKKNESQNSEYRDDLAIYLSEPIEEELIQELKLLPYFNFCVFRENKGAELNLCSEEIYLSFVNNQLLIKSRESTNKKSFVRINNKLVGPHGVIFIEKSNDAIQFRAQTQTGATLEIQTSREDVYFIDVVATEKPDQGKIMARGPEPIEKYPILNKTEEGWSTLVNSEKPFLYLKASGDIPLRQDLYINGKLPIEQLRPYISNGKTKTYIGEVEFDGTKPQNVVLTTADKNSVLLASKKDSFKWNLKNLEKFKLNKRGLNLSSDGDTFYVSHDIFRGAPLDISLSLLSPISYSSSPVLSESQKPQPSSLLVEAGLEYWWTSFLGINSQATYLRWGTGLKYRTKSNKNKDEAAGSTTSFKLSYRFTPGIRGEDPTHGMSLNYLTSKAGNQSAQLVGLGYFANSHSKISPLLLGDQQHLELSYIPISLSSEIKTASLVGVHYASTYKIAPQYSVGWNLGLEQFQATVVNQKSSSMTALMGLNFNFYY